MKTSLSLKDYLDKAFLFFAIFLFATCAAHAQRGLSVSAIVAPNLNFMQHQKHEIGVGSPFRTSFDISGGFFLEYTHPAIPIGVQSGFLYSNYTSTKAI